MVKFRHLISREAKSNKCYVKYLFWKVFKNLYKTIKESNSCNIADLSHSKNTQRELGHSKDIQGTLIGYLSTCWALQWHSKNTWALKALRHSIPPWHSGSHGTWALGFSGTDLLGHSDTPRVLGHSQTQALEQLENRGTRGTLFRSLLLILSRWLWHSLNHLYVQLPGV